MPQPLSDPVSEGQRIISEARQRALNVYLIGGVAIRITTPLGQKPLLDRAFGDIDVVTTRDAGRAMTRFFTDVGYSADRSFNAVNGRTRMLFRDEHNARDLDVLIGEFAMCHVLPILDRARPEHAVVPPADLLLTKLQIIELTAKDVADAYNLLYALPVATDDPDEADSIDAGRIARLCAQNWGLWRTVTRNLARLDDDAYAPRVDVDARRQVSAQAALLLRAIDAQPKSRRWSLRGRVGERLRWYDEPEEAH